MNTIIEKIRAEIERKRDQNWEGENSYYDVNDIKNAGICRHRRILCEELLSFLSDLEKEEKPMELDFEQALYKHFGQVKDFTLGLQIARHFYELGRQSKEQPLLPGFENEQPGIPGKDFVPVAWCDALEQYGIWRIERVEQPVCEGLEEETEKFIETFGWGKTKHLAEKELISATARHFYELGCRRTAEKYDEIEYKRQRADVCDGLEEEVISYFQGLWPGTDTPEECNTHMHFTPPAIMRLAHHFAKWKMEQMMKEARPRFIHNVLDDNTIRKMVHLYSEEIPKEKNVVKLIIIKED